MRSAAIIAIALFGATGALGQTRTFMHNLPCIITIVTERDKKADATDCL